MNKYSYANGLPPYEPYKFIINAYHDHANLQILHPCHMLHMVHISTWHNTYTERDNMDIDNSQL